MSKETGGPAFPDPGRAQSAKQREQLTDVGMTLRDYFAAKAMPQLISLCQDGDGAWSHDVVAQNAYALADAMLAEREK